MSNQTDNPSGNSRKAKSPDCTFKNDFGDTLTISRAVLTSKMRLAKSEIRTIRESLRPTLKYTI